MDKQKERNFWTQSPLGILILAIGATVVGGFILLLISDYNKVEPFLTNVNTALQSLWQYTLNLFNFNIPLGWVLVTLILSRLIWPLFKRTNAYSKFFDKKYVLLQNEYTSLQEKFNQLTKEHEVVSREGGFFLKEFAAANGRIKMLEEELLSVKKESKQTREEGDKVNTLLTQAIKDRDNAEHKLNLSQSTLRQTNKWFRELSSTLSQTRSDFKQSKEEYANTLAALQEKTKLLEEANQKIKELSPDETPSYLKYTRDKFKILIWGWEWSYDTLAKDWHITNLHPLCPNCGDKLTDKSLGIGKEFNKCKCTVCKLTFGYVEDDYSIGEESEDIEAIRKRIKSKVSKGNYKVRSRS